MEESFNVIENEYNMDKISKLPDFLLQQVLSFLTIKQVVQSSLLSKRWKHVWFTIPVLEFDGAYFETKLWCRDREKTRQIQRKRVELYHFAEQNLVSRRRQRLKINKLTLFMYLRTPKTVSRVDRWIDYSLKSNVEELNLDFFMSGGRRYILPQSVLLAKSITVLMLSGCRLESHCCDINLSSLKKLSLVKVRTNDQIIHNLVAGCPVIEDMRFEFCYGLENIHFSALPKLKAIKLESSKLKMVELEASNLYYACITAYYASEINLVQCKNLKELNLEAQCIADEWFRNHISQLPLIEMVTLSNCNKLKNIKISSHILKKLYLHMCKELTKVELDTPALLKLSYLGWSNLSLSLNASAYLSEVIYQMLSPINHWDVQKIELISKLSNSKSLHLLRFESAKVFFLSFI